MPQHQQLDPQLAELAQLAQLSEVAGAPQREQQKLDQQDRATRLQAALHILGLMNQQQTDTAQLEEARRYHTGELEHGANVLAEQKKLRGDSLLQGTISDLLKDPQANPKTIDRMLRTVYPDTYGKAASEQDAADLTANVNKMLPVIRAAKDENTRKQLLSVLPPNVAEAVSTQMGNNPQVATETAQPNVQPGEIGKEWNWYRNHTGVPIYNAFANLLGGESATPRLPEEAPLGHILRYYFGNNNQPITQ